jgi:hypothetical protein
MTIRLAYILTMPSNAAWDGKWSGDRDLNMVVRDIPDPIATRILDRRFTYNFGDGWVAAVEVRRARVGEETTKFHGYEWMIESINTHDKIKA